jgi:hypothetical protein
MLLINNINTLEEKVDEPNNWFIFRRICTFG